MKWMFWKKRRKDRRGLLWLLLVLPAVLVGWVIRERPWRRSYKAVRTTREWQEGRRKQGKTGGPERPAGMRTGSERRDSEKEPEPEQPVRAETRTKYEENRKPPGERAEEKDANLEIIEGIGPKIAGILRAAGITTFRQLANTSTDRLNEILYEGGVRIGPPDTWPEQARLAANEDWDGLDDLKKHLHAGRR